MARRRYVILALVLLAIAGGTFVLQRILFPSKPKALEVLEVKGDVSVVGATGESSSLANGGRVLPGERVQTGADGEAILRGAGSSTITVSERSNVTVDGVLDGVARISVQEGFVRSRVKQGEGAGVEMRGGRDAASVLTRGGDVSVGVDAGGNLAVATLDGTASLSHGGTTRELAAGQTAFVAGGKVEVGEVPTSLLLKVAWPDAGRTRDSATKVSVTLPKGSTALVNGAPVTVGEDGTGTATVMLKEGDNKLTLQARDVAGNAHEEESGVIVLDTRPPEIKIGGAKWQ